MRRRVRPSDLAYYWAALFFAIGTGSSFLAGEQKDGLRSLDDPTHECRCPMTRSRRAATCLLLNRRDAVSRTSASCSSHYGTTMLRVVANFALASASV
jgi:hypothetical protein